ncbi:MAG: hypothetical protein WCF77_05370 [Minisyncoccia bacterium]
MHGFMKVFWRALLAIMAGVGVLFCVMSVIGEPADGRLYWIACCAGGGAVGVGAKMDFMKFRWIIATPAFLVAIKLFSLISGRPLQYADFDTGCAIFFFMSFMEYVCTSPERLR